MGWDVSHRYHFHLIKCLSKEFGFSLDEPYENLSQDVKDILMNGTKDIPVDFSGETREGEL